MKIALLALLVLTVGYAAEAPGPVVNDKPFEPPLTAFFRMDDKFAHPREVVAPQFLFPFELRRGGGAISPGEVVVLVQTDARGYPKTLSVLSSRHEIFTRAAVAALAKARWDCSSETWFYYRALYTLD